MYRGRNHPAMATVIRKPRKTTEEHFRRIKAGALQSLQKSFYTKYVKDALQLYLNPSSFLIASRTDSPLAAVNAACPNRNPFFAKSIAGCTSSFHGNLPYCFHAAYNPLISPGMPEAEGPVVELQQYNYHL